jgi:hypothetical protein
MVTDSGDLVVLAVQRREDDLVGESTLEAGDTLLLQGTWKALDRHLDDPEVLVVDQPDQVRRQAAPLGIQARRTIGVVGAMVPCSRSASCLPRSPACWPRRCSFSPAS